MKGGGKGFGGKEGSKGGKGGGGKGGPKGGCWICNGAHYADQCPTKTRQMRSLGDFMPAAAGGVSKLCGFREVASTRRATKPRVVEAAQSGISGSRWFSKVESAEEDEDD